MPRDGDLVFANFVDFDTLYGHRRDVAGYAAALEAFDRRLPEALGQAARRRSAAADRRSRLRSDLARHRPYARARAGPRHRPRAAKAATSGCGNSFADIGETVAEHLGLPPGRARHVLLPQRSPPMPELPEVETVRRGLQPVLEGARIVAVETRRPDLRFPFPDRFRRSGSPARRVTALGRRAKYLTGASRRRPRADLPSRHVRLVPHRSGGRGRARPASSITSARRTRRTTTWSSTLRSPTGAAGAHHLQRPAPLRLHAALPRRRARPASDACRSRRRADRQRARRRRCSATCFADARAPLKAALLDQTADRRPRQYICLARRCGAPSLSPRRAAGTIAGQAGQGTRRAPSALAEAIRDGHRRAIEAGGSSLRDYIQTDGSLGYFQHSLLGLRPRGRALPAARLQRHDRAHRAERAARPSIARSASDELEPSRHRSEKECAHGLRNDHRRDARQGRPDHAQPAEGAQRAELAGAVANWSPRSRRSTPIPASAPS